MYAERVTERYPCQKVIMCTSGAGRCFAARLRDVSVGGLSFRALWTLNAGERVSVEICLPGQYRPLVLAGTIIWEHEDYNGVRFDGLDAATRTQLLAFFNNFLLLSSATDLCRWVVGLLNQQTYA